MAGRSLLTRLAALAATVGCIVGCTDADARSGSRELRVWAFGAEGEAVAPMIREFEQANSDIRVRVQQIPWTAAHEKLLTAFVGGALPDVAQLGNTWIPEFAALRALLPLDSMVSSDSVHMPRSDYFPGVLATNVVDDTLYGIPWYVDTRAMFYRADLLRRAGVAPPTTWDQWREALKSVKTVQPAGSFPMLMPLDEWAQPVILALQAGAPLLAEHGTRGFFRDPRFRRGFEFYIQLFRDGLAPALANTQVSNLFQEFGAGRVAMYITGPWNVGEFRKRLPDSLQRGAWATAPLPGPNGPGVSLAGGSSLVIMRGARHPGDAFRFITFMSDPARQASFYQTTGDLPARRSAWNTPRLAGDPYLGAFREQLSRVVPMPAVPEWELIATVIAAAAERVARGRETTDQALANLDAQVDGILEKRRWLATHRPAAK